MTLLQIQSPRLRILAICDWSNLLSVKSRILAYLITLGFSLLSWAEMESSSEKIDKQVPDVQSSSTEYESVPNGRTTARFAGLLLGHRTKPQAQYLHRQAPLLPDALTVSTYHVLLSRKQS